MGFEEIFSFISEYTMTSRKAAQALFQSVEYLVTNNVLGDFVECGVWRGGCVMLMALALQELGEYRDIWLFDTFLGMSKPSELDMDFQGRPALETWEERQQQGYNEWCYCPMPEVRRNLQKTNYPIDKLHFVQGDVRDTIPAFLPHSIALLRIDVDWYELTLHVLSHAYPLLTESGILMIDDYGYWQGAQMATDEYFDQQPISWIQVDSSCVMKSGSL